VTAIAWLNAIVISVAVEQAAARKLGQDVARGTMREAFQQQSEIAIPKGQTAALIAPALPVCRHRALAEPAAVAEAHSA
jgi:hypothetical protein